MGYDLEGIKGPKIDKYLNEMMDASGTPIFQECIQVLREMFPGEEDLIAAIPRPDLQLRHSLHPPRLPAGRDRADRLLPHHGEGPPHLRQVQPPPLLGYRSARDILDGMGYDYIAFGEKHFNEDLQYADAIPMFAVCWPWRVSGAWSSA